MKDSMNRNNQMQEKKSPKELYEIAKALISYIKEVEEKTTRGEANEN